MPVPTPLRPLLPGPWKTLPEEDACALLARLAAAEAATGRTPSACTVAIRAVRGMPLASLPGWLLLEAEGSLADGAEAAIPFLFGPRGRLLAPERGSRWVGAALATLPEVNCVIAAPAEFLRLRLGLEPEGEVHRRPVESAAEVDWLPAAAEATRTGAARHLHPIRIAQGPQRTLALETALLADGALHLGRFRLHPRGRLDTESLEPLGPREPLEARIERWRDRIRFAPAPHPDSKP